MPREPKNLEWTTSHPQVYKDIHEERVRAHAKHDHGEAAYSDQGEASMERLDFDHPLWLPVLGEEFGEVGRAVIESRLLVLGNPMPGDVAHLRSELIQLAAMAAAWVVAIDDLATETIPNLIPYK